MSADIKTLQELDDALKGLEMISDKEFLELNAENITAQIPLCDYATGRVMEYMSARLRRIALALPVPPT